MKSEEKPSVDTALFDLGSRLGSLEGYLYAGRRVEKNYLSGWVDNIERQFRELPEEVRAEIAEDYAEVWRKVKVLLAGLYGDEDPDTMRVGTILNDLDKGEI